MKDSDDSLKLPPDISRPATPFSLSASWGTEPHAVLYPDGSISKEVTAEEAMAMARSYNIVNGLLLYER